VARQDDDYNPQIEVPARGMADAYDGLEWEFLPTALPVGVFGPSGIGKSTIIRKLRRLGHPAFDIEEAYRPVSTTPGDDESATRKEYLRRLLELDSTFGKPTFIGMADQTDNRVIRVLLTLNDSHLAARRAQRDELEPSKAGQARARFATEDFDFTLDVGGTPQEAVDALQNIWTEANRIEAWVPLSFERAQSKHPLTVPQDEVDAVAARWLLFPAAIGMNRRFPLESAKFRDWLTPLLERYNALRIEQVSVVKIDPTQYEYASKVGGIMRANPSFNVTAIGERTSLVGYSDKAEELLKEQKLALISQDLEVEASLLGDKLGKPMGGNSPSWLFWDICYMPDKTFALQRKAPLYPVEAIRHANERTSVGLGTHPLYPVHGVVTSPGSGTDFLRLSNRAGSGGMPFLNMKRREVHQLTKGRNARKGTVIRPTINLFIGWLDLGFPIEGPFWDELRSMTKTAVHRRGDRGMSIEFRTLAALEPSIMAWMLGRLVLISPPIVTTGQSLVTQPLQVRIGSGQTSTGYDVRTPRFTRGKARSMITASYSASLRGEFDYVEGLDVTLFGENLSMLQRAIELATVADLLPESADLIFVASDTPLVLQNDWIHGVKQELAPGESATMLLPGPSDQPDFSEQECTVYRRVVDLKDLYLKVNYLLDNSTFQFGEFAIDAESTPVPIPGILPSWYKGSGGRRHGDANTLIGNSIVTEKCLYIAEYIVNNWRALPEFHDLVSPEHPFNDPDWIGLDVADLLIRGDDTLARIKVVGGFDIHEVAAGLLTVTGQMASAAKQEGSGIPGQTAAGVSSRLYTNKLPEGFTASERFLLRSIFTEHGGEYFPELSDEPVALIAPVETVMSRMMVMLDGVLGNALPGNQVMLDLVQDNAPNMLIFKADEEIGEMELRTLSARRYALRQLRRGFVTEAQLPEIEKEWLDSNVYPKLKARASVLNHQPHDRMPGKQDPRLGFDELVELVQDGVDYDVAYNRLFGIGHGVTPSEGPPP